MAGGIGVEVEDTEEVVDMEVVDTVVVDTVEVTGDQEGMEVEDIEDLAVVVAVEVDSGEVEDLIEEDTEAFRETSEHASTTKWF